jgi:uncharacterized membrane protein
MDTNLPLFTNDAIVFGLLVVCLGLIFHTATLNFFKGFYRFVPVLLLCYLVPSLLSTFNVISPEHSNLWSIARDYFLPASLVLMTLSTDLKGIIRLGPKALIMFLTGTLGIIIGGPVAIIIMSLISPETVGGEGIDAVWRGLSTLAGSWIGGGANQTAMLELYQFNPEKYSGMITVDIVVANIWMAFILYGAGKSEAVDRWLKADTTAIDELKEKMKTYELATQKNATFTDLMKIIAIGFGTVGLSHWFAGSMPSLFENTFWKNSILSSGFFWIVVVATTTGLLLSFSKARSLEGVGASKIGSIFIYLLVAVIGMKMDITEVVNSPMLILVGIIWMATHVLLLVVVAKIIKAPFFFLAVGSKANVGGAASAPIVASAFHPVLAPVGVLLAVLGYALGTYGAIVCATLMEIVSP